MSQQPQWLIDLTDKVCQTFETEQAPAEIGCHVHQEADLWEVALFFSAIELVGGPYDGERIAPLFTVDIAAVLALFDPVEHASWQTQSHDEADELGNHFCVQGTVNEHHVALRILAESPGQFPASCQINTLDREVENTW